jgi:N-methylhydantoinase A/oxoprolinase/acetone carboxylase beta subunit
VLRVGVDIGGTNTDVAVIVGDEVVATCKIPTQDEIGVGIQAAIDEALSTASAGPEDVSAVMLGTTQFTNAFIERRRLQLSGILRICLPSNQDIEPMLDWPSDLKQALGGHIYMVRGGYEFDGREATALDENAIGNAARDMRRKGLVNVAVSCMFSTVNDAMEIRAGEIICHEIPNARITLSSRIGRLSLIDRENAALINASLVDLGVMIVDSFAGALNALGVSAPFYVSQNDGSLMSPEYAARNPVLTFASGAANSIRGAAYLTTCDDAIVIDIGGTTTDVGVIKNGYPRERSLPGKLAGIRTNFRMPELVSIGLGGGSIVHLGDHLRVGPESVGRELDRKALVFGGDVLTATDIAVAAGRVRLGNPSRLADLPARQAGRADQLIQAMIAEAIDKMKTSAADVPVIVVGGGRILVSHDLPGVARMQIPDHADVANAVGAAIAQLSGHAEQIFDYGQIGRADAVAAVKQKARYEVIATGADPATLREVQVEETLLPYADGRLTSVRVKVVGDVLFEETD